MFEIQNLTKMKWIIRVCFLVLNVQIGKCVLQNKDFCGSKSDGYYPHPDDCIKYVSCLQGFTFEMTCPSGPSQLYYDEKQKNCNLKEFAFCSVTTTTVSTSTITTPTTEKVTTKTLPSPSETTTPVTTTLAPGERIYEDAILCDPSTCKLPNCRCASTNIPGGFKKEEIPHMVLVTMDDAILARNYLIYLDLFKDRFNPNGCPIKTTFFVSHLYTDYNKVAKLQDAGHEIADHSVTQRYPDTFWREGSYNLIKDEILDQKKNLETLGYASTVKGWRSPYLRTGENTFKILADNNFLYDSSLTTNEGQRWWPYTLDHLTVNYPDRCANKPCRKKAYPNLWEIPLNSWVDGDTGNKCGMFTSCFRSLVDGQADSVYNLFKSNFDIFRNDNKQPFPIFGVGAYFDHEEYVWRRNGFKRFVKEILANHDDVYFVTMQQAIAWMKNPTKLKDIKTFKPWSCS